jgi:hypothetical protein
MSILTSASYIEKDEKYFFDRLSSVLLSTQSKRLLKIQTLRSDLLYLQDYILELKQQEKSFLTDFAVLSDDTNIPDKYETLPELTPENKAPFFIKAQVVNLIDRKELVSSDGQNFTKSTLEKFRTEALNKIGDVESQVRWWNQKILYTKLLIIKKMEQIDSLSEEDTSRIKA